MLLIVLTKAFCFGFDFINAPCYGFCTCNNFYYFYAFLQVGSGIDWFLVSLSSMKLGPKNGWTSVVPLCVRGSSASATRFCMFPKVKSAGFSPGNTPVYLNVYDLTSINGYVYWAGIGIFHTGVEG